MSDEKSQPTKAVRRRKFNEPVHAISTKYPKSVFDALRALAAQNSEAVAETIRTLVTAGVKQPAIASEAKSRLDVIPTHVREPLEMLERRFRTECLLIPEYRALISVEAALKTLLDAYPADLTDATQNPDA